MASQKQQDLVGKLREGIKGIQNSDDYKKWLRATSKFYTYSFSNQMLIHLQNENASRVAGFWAWKEMGRSVKKGEKGIAILAPNIKKEQDEKGKEVKTLKGFHVAYVFDISQTEGEDIPEVYHPLKGEAPQGIFDKLCKFLKSEGWPVTFEKMKPGLYGYVSKGAGIRLAEGQSHAQTLATLTHEAGHALLGHVGDHGKTKQEEELEAETASWVICENLGLKTDSTAFTYLAIYAGKEESIEWHERLETSATKAMKVAKKILTALKPKKETA